MGADHARPADEAETAAGAATASLYGSELAAGAAVGGYAVVRVASRGGFGVVYEGVAPDGRRVALKVLHARLADSVSVLKRFQQEELATRRIDHPNVVGAFELGSLVDGRPFLAMEWIAGETLEEALRARGPLDLDACARLAEGLSAALAAAHAAGVVHRDLKCSNVMLVPADGATGVKLLDFGIAKILDLDAGLTATGARLGTPATMAPEQILGHRVTPATDVYALGVVLFHALTGRPPFALEGSVALEDAHLHAAPPRASEVGVRVPEAVADVIARCMAKSPAHRYASAAEAGEALRRAFAAPDAAPRPLQSESQAAVGLRLEGDAGALAEARSRCVAEGMTPALGRERSFLAIVPLPEGAGDARGVRRRALRLALGLPRALSRVVHAAAVTTLRVQGAPQFVGGALFEYGWSAAAAAGEVVASAAALEGLEHDLELGPARDDGARVVLATKP